MNPEVVAAVMVPLAFFATCVVLPLGIKWINYKKALVRTSSESAGAMTGVEQRLARVEVALDDLTSELSRLTEGQQFLTKVLTDRTSGAASLSAGQPPR